MSKLVVVGQGYVGLPLAMGAVDAGFDVVGVGVDERRVTRLAAADSSTEDITSAQRTADHVFDTRHRCRGESVELP